MSAEEIKNNIERDLQSRSGIVSKTNTNLMSAISQDVAEAEEKP